MKKREIKKPGSERKRRREYKKFCWERRGRCPMKSFLYCIVLCDSVTSLCSVRIWNVCFSLSLKSWKWIQIGKSGIQGERERERDRRSWQHKREKPNTTECIVTLHETFIFSIQFIYLPFMLIIFSNLVFFFFNK